MHRRSFIYKTGAASIVAFFYSGGLLRAYQEPSLSEFEKRFVKPLLSDHPMVYWFWMNGHVSKEGITLDLEAMKRVGIGGVFNFDAGISIPKGPVEYFSREWLALKQHAIQEAARLGLEFVLHNCPGWSASGGPWISPELAMQQITWSETVISGGEQLRLQLPLPFHKMNFYRDVAVLAYPSLRSEKALQDYTVSTNTGLVDKALVTGEKPGGVTVQPTAKTGAAWLLFTFKEPHPVHFLTLQVTAMEGTNNEDGRTSIELQSSDDGSVFTTVATISTGLASELAAGYKFITYDIPPVKAKYFRLFATCARRFSQVRFSGYTRLHNFLEKTGNRFQFSGEATSPVYTSAEQDVPADSILTTDTIVDLTGNVDENGILHWDAPQGSWTVLRFGHTVTGAINKAAPEKGTGLECDKFNPSAIDFHFDRMLEHLGPALKVVAGMCKTGLLIDSYEAGPQTWTNAFPEEFRKRRGYAIIPHLPALTGRILRDVQYTEQALWDYRRTQADLIADHYYGRFTERCRQAGFTSYAEPYDKGPFEETQIGSRVDVSMGEFWYGLHSLLQGNLAVQRTSKLAASIMNTNGRAIVGAEAFTSEPESSRWQEYPFSLKALGDKMFCQGVNKMIIHRFVHQPNPYARPGMTMGPWGIHFDRTNTWFEGAGGWLRYMARCQVLLRQGVPVKDLLYFTGEEANVYTKVRPNELHPSPPAGYDYDLVNAETIHKNVRVENGRIGLPNGMQYSVLVLQDFERLTLPLLKKLQELVRSGLVLVGEKPVGPSGIVSAPEEAEFRQIMDELWGPLVNREAGEHTVGKGQVVTLQSFYSLLPQPDFTYTSRSSDAPLLYLHRRIGEADIYFVCNQRRTFEEVVCTFRVDRKQPEIWDAVTGSILSLPVFDLVNDTVNVPLQLQPYGSLFVVFRRPVSQPNVVSLTKDGNVLMSAKSFVQPQRKLFPAVSNDFTIAVWAKPEMPCMLRPSLHMGNLAHPFTDYYAIYPASGKQLYGNGHATCGLAIGRNGIAVWENENYPVLSLAAEMPLAGWTYVVLVYQKGRPSVFVNGRLIKIGQQSFANIHPSLSEAYLHEGASYFNGDMTTPVLYKQVLTADRIFELAQMAPNPVTSPTHLSEFVVHKNGPALLIGQTGRYTLSFSNGKAQAFSVSGAGILQEMKNNWTVYFPPQSGAPHHMKLPKLISLHRHPVDGLKYFSGTATYQNQFSLAHGYATGKERLLLDLGSVEVVAQVIVNGKDLGLLWKRPYRTDISEFVNKGLNHLEVRVTNLWPNRLIGDENIPDPNRFSTAGGNGFEHLAGSGFESVIGNSILELPDWFVRGNPQPNNGRVGFATWKQYTKNDPLLESGLIGPVTLRSAEIVTI